MPVLMLILLVSVFTYLWLARRGTSLTRACRWRLDRTLGADQYRCAACGAITKGTPRICLQDGIDAAQRPGEDGESGGTR
ncbi:MAG: hypothetical protein WBA91_14450 [Paracoccaceae bacterium]